MPSILFHTVGPRSSEVIDSGTVVPSAANVVVGGTTSILTHSMLVPALAIVGSILALAITAFFVYRFIIKRRQKKTEPRIALKPLRLRHDGARLVHLDLERGQGTKIRETPRDLIKKMSSPSIVFGPGSPVTESVVISICSTHKGLRKDAGETTVASTSVQETNDNSNSPEDCPPVTLSVDDTTDSEHRDSLASSSPVVPISEFDKSVEEIKDHQSSVSFKQPPSEKLIPKHLFVIALEGFISQRSIHVIDQANQPFSEKAKNEPETTLRDDDSGLISVPSLLDDTTCTSTTTVDSCSYSDSESSVLDELAKYSASVFPYASSVLTDDRPPKNNNFFFEGVTDVTEESSVDQIKLATPFECAGSEPLTIDIKLDTNTHPAFPHAPGNEATKKAAQPSANALPSNTTVIDIPPRGDFDDSHIDMDSKAFTGLFESRAGFESMSPEHFAPQLVADVHDGIYSHQESFAIVELRKPQGDTPARLTSSDTLRSARMDLHKSSASAAGSQFSRRSHRPSMRTVPSSSSLTRQSKAVLTAKRTSHCPSLSAKARVRRPSSRPHAPPVSSPLASSTVIVGPGSVQAKAAPAKSSKTPFKGIISAAAKIAKPSKVSSGRTDERKPASAKTTATPAKASATRTATELPGAGIGTTASRQPMKSIQAPTPSNSGTRGASQAPLAHCSAARPLPISDHENGPPTPKIKKSVISATFQRKDIQTPGSLPASSHEVSLTSSSASCASATKVPLSSRTILRSPPYSKCTWR